MNTNNTVRPVDSLNIVTVVTDETQVNVTRPVTNVVRVVGPGPIGPVGPQGIQGETGLTVTDLFVARGNDTWSTTGSLQISGSLIVSQSVTGLSGFTGSLLGTAATASYFAGYGNSTVLINQHETYNTFTGSIQTQVDGLSNATSSYVLNNVTASMLQPYVLTSVTQSMLRPYVLTSVTQSMLQPYVLTSVTSSMLQPYVLTSVTSSMLQPYVLTSVTQSMLQPYVLTSVTGSMLQPYVLTSATSSMIVSGALTASFVNTLKQDITTSGSVFISGSIIHNGNYIQTGINILSGSNIVTGSSTLIGQSQTTGSVNISGSVRITGSLTADFVYLTGSLQGTAATASFVTSSNVQGPHGMNSVISASHAVTASYYLETDPIFVAKSGSLATTGSNRFVGNQIITGSVYLKSGSVIDSTGADIYIKAGVGFNAGVALYNNNSTQYLAVDDTGSYANKFTVADKLTVSGLTTTQNQQITGSLSQGIEGNIATGEGSHAEGSITKAIGNYSHAEGDYTQAVGNYSHAEGQETITLASAQYSHAEGWRTIASANHQHVQGQWNATSSVQSAFIVGNGSDNDNRSNLIHAAGNEVQISGSMIFSTGGITGSLLGTAATASFVTSSNVQGPHGMNSVVSASYALTASYVNVLTQDVTISGSLFTTGSNTLIGNTYLTGSLNVSGSTVQTGDNTLIGNTVLSGSISISGSSVITGGTVMYGSLNISGSTTQTGNNTLSGNTLLSGSIIISGAFSTNNPTVKIYGDTTHEGYLRFNPVSTNINTSISASYIYVSGSTNDLYFSQNGNGYNNVTRLRWLEGNLYTGLLHGAVISQVNSNTYQVASGSGIIVNLNASIPNDPYPTIQYLQWPNLTKTIDPLSASFDQQFVSIDSTNNIFAQGTPYTDGQYNTLIPIGIVLHQNHISINAVQTFPSVAYGWKQRSYDFIKAFGPLKISGYNLTQSGSSVGGLLLSGGTAWVDGRNYTIDPNNTAYIVEGTGIATSKIFRYYQSGSNWQNEWGYDTNAGAGYTAIDPAQYSNAGTLTALANNNKWSIQRVFYFPNSATKALYVYYGNAQYDTKTDAIAAIATEAFNEAPNTTANAIFIGYMILQKIANFNTPATYEFKAAGLFRAGGAGGAGGGGVTALSNLTDVSVSTSVYGDLLMKGAGAWVNSKQLSGSYGITGSLNVTGSSAIVGSSVISGSLNVTGSLYANFAYLTGSLLGTAATASFVTSSNVQGPYGMNSIVSASHAVTVRSYAQLIGDGATNNITVTHGLGTNDLHITVYSASGNFENIIPDIHRTDTNTIQVRFVNPPGLNQYRVYISV